MSDYKPGDKLVNNAGENVTFLGYVRYVTVKFLDGTVWNYEEAEVKPAPEPPITDAERIAAACHQGFRGISRTANNQLRVSGFSDLGEFPSKIEALDAWVRFQRSIDQRKHTGG